MGEEEFVGADGLGGVALVPHVAKGELPGVGDHCCRKQKIFTFPYFIYFLHFVLFLNNLGFFFGKCC